MIRKYHNEEDPQNNHETPGRQTKQSNQLSLSSIYTNIWGCWPFCRETLNNLINTICDI